jgi:hypothetical protein
MSKRSRVAGLWLLVLLFAAVVYGPFLDEGVLGGDGDAFVEASRMGFDELRPQGIDGEHWAERRWLAGARPLELLSIGLSSRMWTDGGFWTQYAISMLRLENLLLLLLTAFFAGRAVERMLEPWCSDEQGALAGAATRLLLIAHPLCVPTVSAAASRGDLLGAVFATAALSAFLRGRQTNKPSLIGVSLALTLACAFATQAAYLLPAWLAVAEFLSARRHRTVPARARTALTTLGVFGLAVMIDAGLRVAFGGDWRPDAVTRSLGMLRDPQGFWVALGWGFERIGLAILPVNAVGLGAWGYVFAGVLLAVVLQPALHAARSAPRLWTGVLTAWVTAMALAGLYRADLRVHPGDLTHASVLLPAALVMSIGVAVAATALSGKRRTLMPIAVAIGYSILAQGEAQSLKDATRATERLRVALAPALSMQPPIAHLVLVDEPHMVKAHAVIGDSLDWISDPAFSRRASDSPPPPRIRRTSADGLSSLVREEFFDSMREAGLVLALTTDGDAERRLLRLEVPTESDRSAPREGVVWREEGRSPVLDVDPLHRRALIVRGRPETQTARPPRLGWRVSDPEHETGATSGVWIAGVDGPLAVFDLADEQNWLLGGRGRRVWLEDELANPIEAQLAVDLPTIAGVTEPDKSDAEDWIFEPDLDSLARPLDGEAHAELVLFDREGFHVRRLDVVEDRGVWRVPGANTLVRRWEELPEGLTWALEWRTAEGCLARSRGH